MRGAKKDSGYALGRAGEKSSEFQAREGREHKGVLIGPPFGFFENSA